MAQLNVFLYLDLDGVCMYSGDTAKATSKVDAVNKENLLQLNSTIQKIEEEGHKVYLVLRGSHLIDYDNHKDLEYKFLYKDLYTEINQIINLDDYLIGATILPSDNMEENDDVVDFAQNQLNINGLLDYDSGTDVHIIVAGDTFYTEDKVYVYGGDGVGLIHKVYCKQDEGFTAVQEEDILNILKERLEELKS